MSDTDSIKTDRSHVELQQKYDKLAMEFAKTRMQLNVLKKAYTSKISRCDQRSMDSLDQLEGSKYDTISTNSLDFQDDYKKFNNSPKFKGEEAKQKDLLILKQDIENINSHIQRVLEITKSELLDYNMIMSEITNCKNIHSKNPSKNNSIFDYEFLLLKNSVNVCLYNLLYHCLESRTKVNANDAKLNYPYHYCLEKDYKLDDNRWQEVFVSLVLHFFRSFMEDLHKLIEYILKDIDIEATKTLSQTIKSFSLLPITDYLILDKITVYCTNLNNIKLNEKYILLKNIFTFISVQYSDFVKFVKDLIKSDNSNEILSCCPLRQCVISLMVLKFPVRELVLDVENWDSKIIDQMLNDVFNISHILLHAINIMEFEYFYKKCQIDVHWHIKNSLVCVNESTKAKKDLNSPFIANECFEKALRIYNDKLNEEVALSKRFEQEKIHWEAEYNLQSRKNKFVENNIQQIGSTGLFTIANQLGKLESSIQLSDEVIARENEIKNFFEKKINQLVHKNKELMSQNNLQKIEISALSTKLNHSIHIRNNLEVKLQDALEHVQELKEEFQLTSTSYETQLRALTEHLASLNETVMLERKHIDDLNSQLKMKGV
ncbi:uncharacterized protein LOC126900106 isoform X2 [Daktulosphaira vitifoliae]|uniref:uncharacterized protein LOC126900106 isoform X2 n=1 Tax=Daktulosphaira vitifoliae TaxID=58002 RepID=UPI0021AA3E0B|nr:uncharacterized protein LOC126900106 isoform X2 [Daktulosphaira vitifoliae]